MTDSGLPVPGNHTGGCGFCIGTTHGLTIRCGQYSPSQRNGPGVVQHFTIRSWASSKRGRFSVGGYPACSVSTAVPRTKPDMMRPPLMQSSIAISSAILTGSLTAITFPSMAIFARLVRWVITAASTFTDGFMHQ